MYGQLSTCEEDSFEFSFIIISTIIMIWLFINASPQISTYEEDSFYPNLDLVGETHDDELDSYTSAVKKLAESLYSSSSVKTAYFATYLQKRLSILKRIHLALNREKAREKVINLSLMKNKNK